MHRSTHGRRPLAAAAALACLIGVSALGNSAPPAEAAKDGSCAGFAVTAAGRTYRGDQDRRLRAAQVGETIEIRGRYVRFAVDARTFTVRDYTLTGVDSPRADKNLPIDAPTVVYESKVPDHGKTLTSAVELDLNNEGVVLRRNGGGQEVKIQAKDCAQGGLFQMEVEPGVRQINTLGPDFAYTGQPTGEERLCFTNGAFAGYDSPQAAELLGRTEQEAEWAVQSGGRIGMVIGEDAEEGGCQA